jgi:23S rRNA maturation mini-RNase III
MCKVHVHGGTKVTNGADVHGRFQAEHMHEPNAQTKNQETEIYKRSSHCNITTLPQSDQVHTEIRV